MQLFRLILAAAIGSMSVVVRAQSTMESWDRSSATVDTEIDGDVEYVVGQIEVGLDAWSEFEAFADRVRAEGDVVLGAIPRLAAVRIQIGTGEKAEIGKRLDTYASLSGVRYAERIGVLREASSAGPALPDDVLFPMQWHLENTGQSGGTPDADLDAVDGWLISSGSSDIIVAVLDNGINSQHPEFAGRLLAGWDFVGEDDNPTAYGHGNPVTGMLAANASNNFEVAGIDHHCKIIPVRVGAGFWFDLFDIAQGLDYAAMQHAHIVSMSFGAKGSSQLVQDAVVAAASTGATLFAAAGNHGGPDAADKVFPAMYPEVMSIGATDSADKRASYSSGGQTLDFVAPGDEVVTVSAGGLGSGSTFAGTSAAAPLAAGIGAVMKSLNPHLSFAQIYELLRLGAEDQVGDPVEDTLGWDPYFGWGRLNLRRSLEVLCGCQGGESLIASPQHVSIAAAEVLALRIDAGREHAGKTYWVFGSASGSGTWPFGPLTLPITPDDYTRFTFSDANGPVLVNTHGLLDDAGQAMAFVMLPSGATPASAGVLQHVVVVFDGRAAPAHAVLATNVTSTTVEP